MKLRLLILLGWFGFIGAAVAQTSARYVWWNPVQNDSLAVEGQGWHGKALQNPYDRLPASAKINVSADFWEKSRNSSGLMIRFRASTDRLVVRYVVANKQTAKTVPATGTSGVDLYVSDSDGIWSWCGSTYTFGDTIQYQFDKLTRNDSYHNKGREYRLYLPLFNTVNWLQVGVPVGDTLVPLTGRIDKPIVVLGTTIAQGSSASRPSMAWPTILSRKLDRPLINLSFAGTGQAEKAVVDLLPQLDAKLYILDCLPYMVAATGVEAVVQKERLVSAVKTVRRTRPDTPILITENVSYVGSSLSPVKKPSFFQSSSVAEQALAELKADSVKNLYLLPRSSIHLTADATLDGVLPTDLGMQQYADAYETITRSILNEPIDTVSTTIPKTQFRDAGIYDWDARHREILTRLRTEKPRTLFIGNSITHYWGGASSGAPVRGSASWDSVLAPLKTLNLGYGYDRLENVLWRVYHDELAGYAADQILMLIGTNNIQISTDAQIITGMTSLVRAIQQRQPTTDLIMLGILPRRAYEARVDTLNQQLAKLATSLKVKFINPGKVFLQPDGKIDESFFVDGLHPTGEGYWMLIGGIIPYLKTPK